MVSRPAPTRRSIIATGAWAAPVVAVGAAAPAFAASACIPQTLNWNNYTAGQAAPSAITIGSTKITQSIAYGTATNGSATPPGANSGFVQTGPSGGIAGNRFTLAMGTAATPIQVGDFLTWTLTFSTPVQNVQFTVTDIDRATGSWKDSVAVSPAPTSASKGSNVNTGTGTTADPWTSTDNVNVLPTSGAGNVAVTYKGPISSIVLTYKNLEPGTGSQMLININSISFCA